VNLDMPGLQNSLAVEIGATVAGIEELEQIEGFAARISPK